MAGSVRVVQSVEAAIRCANGPGVLVGLEGGLGITIVGAIVTNAEAGDIQEHLPLPLAVAGYFGQTTAPPEHRKPVGLLSAQVDAEGVIQWRWTHANDGEASSPTVITAGADWQQGWTLIRAKATGTIQLYAGEESQEHVLATFGNLGRAVAGPDALYVTTGGAVSLADVASVDESDPATTWDLPLTVTAYPVLTSPDPATAPALILPSRSAPTNTTVRNVHVSLDVLGYAQKGTPGTAAVNQTLRPALLEQLAGASMLLAKDTSKNITALRAFHFLPPGFQHHVTVIYPLPGMASQAAEAALEPQRAALHVMLGLAMDRPLLRIADALTLDGTGAGAGAATSDKLRDVHVGIAPSKDRFNDSGWGCAYRSLQTLWSWYRAAGYCTAPPPSHADIQATLVALGDKDPSFRGSKQWIGALELGFVLEEGLGMQSRVIPLRSGADLPSKARELAHHFDTQGTPVMVGGGVLAYTLLGVDWNEATGAVAFLILDPHYTGGDDLRKIQAGQWVAWKQYGDNAAAGGKLLHDNAHYNLLCPQQPNGV